MSHSDNGPVPDWFRAIQWGNRYPVELVRDNRALIPERAGVYVFLNAEGPVQRQLGRTLYVGKAGNLRTRLPSYLASPDTVTLLSPRRKDGSMNSSLRHVGKALVLGKIATRMNARSGGPCGVWLTWTVTTEAAGLERLLVEYLQPQANQYLRGEGWE